MTSDKIAIEFDGVKRRPCPPPRSAEKEMRKIIIICVFAACLGPFNTAGEATDFMGSQKDWVVEHSNIVADGTGFDAILTLRGPEKGNICSAIVNGAPPLCPQTSATMDQTGRITHTNK